MSERSSVSPKVFPTKAAAFVLVQPEDGANRLDVIKAMIATAEELGVGVTAQLPDGEWLSANADGEFVSAKATMVLLAQRPRQAPRPGQAGWMPTEADREAFRLAGNLRVEEVMGGCWRVRADFGGDPQIFGSEAAAWHEVLERFSADHVWRDAPSEYALECYRKEGFDFLMEPGGSYRWWPPAGSGSTSWPAASLDDLIRQMRQWVVSSKVRPPQDDLEAALGRAKSAVLRGADIAARPTWMSADEWRQLVTFLESPGWISGTTGFYLTRDGML